MKRVLASALIVGVTMFGLAGCGEEAKVETQTTTSTPEGTRTDTTTQKTETTGTPPAAPGDTSTPPAAK